MTAKSYRDTKYCSKCEKWVKTVAVWCPCGNRYRTHPHNQGGWIEKVYI